MTKTPTTKIELETEIAQYRGFLGVEVPAADSEELSNNEKRTAVLTALRKEHGTALTITSADIEANPAFVEAGTKEGDVVLLEADELEALYAAREPAADEEGKEDEKAYDEALDTAMKPSENAELTYLGRTVTNISNKIISGALYKEVSTGTETFTITVAEFDRDVTPRSA